MLTGTLALRAVRRVLSMQGNHSDWQGPTAASDGLQGVGGAIRAGSQGGTSGGPAGEGDVPVRLLL